MIIDFPTGFYKSILPPAPNSQGNVTYTISTQPPPRGSLFFLKIDNNLASVSPPLIATLPQGDIQGGSLTAFRLNTVVDREPRPIGSVLEFTDAYRQLNVRQEPLDESVDFPRFNSNSVDGVNPKLIEAYEVAQREVIRVSQQSNSKQIEIENLERLTNTSIASLEATEEALKFLPDDLDLLDAKAQSEAQITSNEAQIEALRSEIEVLDAKRSELAESVRRLSRVIS